MNDREYLVKIGNELLRCKEPNATLRKIDEIYKEWAYFDSRKCKEEPIN